MIRYCAAALAGFVLGSIASTGALIGGFLWSIR